jgi:hypothetical protein
VHEIHFGTVRLSGGARGLGHGRFRGTEDDSASKLPIPLDHSGWTFNLTVLKERLEAAIGMR